MRTRSRLLICLVAAAALSAVSVFAPPRANAADDATGYVDSESSPVVRARTGSGPGPNAAHASAPGADCISTVSVTDDVAFPIYDEAGNQMFSDTGRWIETYCADQNGNYTVFMGTFPEGRQVDPRALADEAMAKVVIGESPFGTSPSANQTLYVHVPTWLWLEPGYWTTYSATASAGRVTATATVRPVRAVWTPGNGERHVCAGPGTPWRKGMPENATSCSYTYVHSSAGRPDGRYTLGVTVEFEASWTSNVGAGGSLGSITRTASTGVRVGEIQAIET